VSIKEAWDDENLRFAFRRIMDARQMVQWYELIQIIGGIEFSEEEDVII
jgi:hypothetical protein